MRMSELSELSGVAVPSIKFYLRESLLAPGEYSSPNQASYDEEHVQRLRLVRALIEVGGLSISSVRAVLAAIDNTEMPLDWAFGIAQAAIPGSLPTRVDDIETVGTRAVSEAIATVGWRISAGNPGQEMAARVIETYDRLGFAHLIDIVPEYLRAAEIVAEADLSAVAVAADRAAMVETVVIGTVLGDTLLAGLRRIAQERVSDKYFPVPPEIPVPSELADCDPEQPTEMDK